MSRRLQIVFDAHDPARLGDFWVEALGYTRQPPPPDYESWEAWATEMGIPEENWNDAAAIVDPEGERPRVFIQKVPEGKTAKNRMHLDISVSGGPGTDLDTRRERINAEAERLVALGASIGEAIEQRDEFWVVMHDPEGNEFCLH